MSTAGVAHHQGHTFAAVVNVAEVDARAARFAARDAAYRAALRIPGTEPLPSSLGAVVHSKAGQLVVTRDGGRVRARSRAL